MAASNIFETWYFVAETIKIPTVQQRKEYGVIWAVYFILFFYFFIPMKFCNFPLSAFFLCHKAQFYTMANLSENTSVALTQLQIKFVAVFLVVPLKFDTASTGGFVLTETSDLIA